MLYIRFPLSLRNVEDLLHERGVEISHQTVRFWWNRFGLICMNSHKKPLPVARAGWHILHKLAGAASSVAFHNHELPDFLTH